MSWTRRLWRTLPIALVIVLMAATAAFAGSKPAGVAITGTPTSTYPNYFNSDANVTVHFDYTSDPDSGGSTTVRAWLLQHGTATEVADSGNLPIADAAGGSSATVNVKTPATAVDGEQYDVRIVVTNSNGSCDPVIENGGGNGAAEIDKVAPGTPPKPNLSNIQITGSVTAGGIQYTRGTTGTVFTWTAAEDDRAGIKTYWVLINGSAAEVPIGSLANTSDLNPNWTYSGGDLSEGTHYFHIRAQDNAFNYGAEVCLEFVVDRTGPTVTANLVGATGSADSVLKWRMNDTTPTVNWDASTDAGVGLHATQPYQIQIGTTNTGFELEGPSFAAGPTYTATGPFVEATEYY
ncbi:MAG: hypothetical protein VB144_09190, partial [Clostridia bacterium]|nr:hypothetical protein [Clostridia bacterium]